MHSDNQKTYLFPPIDPFKKHRLDTKDGHDLYIEEIGNPAGTPVLFLHGGPGAGISDIHRQMFDPDLFRVVLFDQRGSGRSRPFGSIENNTTWHLVADIEAIRAHLGIDQWVIFGGSWGSTLGLVYGITYPQRCLGFVLRGIFLASRDEIDWFLYEMGRFYPEAWQRFVSFLPENERDNLLASYHKRLVDVSPAVAIPAADAWASYENSCATLNAEMRGGGGRISLSLARLEAHYFHQKCFLDEGYILDNISTLKHYPAVLIQGRHDVICPPISAMKLAKSWEGAELIIVDDAGHSAFELGILFRLVSVMNQTFGSPATKSRP